MTHSYRHHVLRHKPVFCRLDLAPRSTPAQSLLHKFGPDNLKVKMSHDEPDDPEHLASVRVWGQHHRLSHRTSLSGSQAAM